jgi:hypothetical protein
MYTRVLKGIPGLDAADVQSVFGQGITCNWWRMVGSLPAVEIPKRLTAKELDQHLRQYGQPNAKKGGHTNGAVSPFISTTAGTRQAGPNAYWEWPALFTALLFATDKFTSSGWVFRAWLASASVPSVEIPWLAEEIRDVHLYGAHFKHHHQGELTAKISIPPVCIAGADFYDLGDVEAALAADLLPSATMSLASIHRWTGLSRLDDLELVVGWCGRG